MPFNFIRGTPGPDTLFGTPDSDFIEGGGGNDTLFGGGGDDFLAGSHTASPGIDPGLDTLDGGPGFDDGELDWTGFFPGEDGFIFVYDGANAFQFHGGQIYAQTVSVERFEITGSDGNDWIETGGENDQLSGGAGNDVLKGNAGIDTLGGDAGDDQLFGGDGNDQLTDWAGSNRLYGGAGNDSLTIGFLTKNNVDGGDGSDRLIFSHVSESINIDKAVAFFAAPPSELSGIYIDGQPVTFVTGIESYEFWTSGNGNHVLFGGDGDDLFSVGNGNNYVGGSGGNDRIFFESTDPTAVNQGYGGDGNDLISNDTGARAASVLDGENGNDTIYGGPGNDYIVGGDGNDIVVGGFDGQDSLYAGAGNDYLVAADANNDGVGSVLDGGAGSNQLYALVGSGNDYAVGGEGADTISTGGGSDYVFGNDGNDTIVAGTATDYIYGNAGNDFIYTDDLVTNSQDFLYVSGLGGFGTGVDTVADFTPGPGGDVAVILSTPGLTSFAQVQANMVDIGVYTVVALSGNDQLYLYNVDPFQLTPDNFLFL